MGTELWVKTLILICVILEGDHKADLAKKFINWIWEQVSLFNLKGHELIAHMMRRDKKIEEEYEP